MAGMSMETGSGKQLKEKSQVYCAVVVQFGVFGLDYEGFEQV